SGSVSSAASTLCVSEASESEYPSPENSATITCSPSDKLSNFSVVAMPLESGTAVWTTSPSMRNCTSPEATGVSSIFTAASKLTPSPTVLGDREASNVVIVSDWLNGDKNRHSPDPTWKMAVSSPTSDG